jgi:hypothetical protein
MWSGWEIVVLATLGHLLCWSRGSKRQRVMGDDAHSGSSREGNEQHPKR